MCEAAGYMDEPAVESRACPPVISTTIKAAIIPQVRALHGFDVVVRRELHLGEWSPADMIG